MIISKKQVDACFEGKTSQEQWIVDLYKIVFPEWDDIEKIDGWPKVEEELAQYIMRKAMEFDRIHHPNVMAGGAWMNNGFSTSGNGGMKPNEVSREGVTVRLKGE